MGRSHSIRLGCALLLLATVTGIGVAAAASRFEVVGHVLPAHQAEGLLADPRGRADSSAVAAGLARLVGALQDLGYLDATARAERIGADTTQTRWRVTVTEGERRRLAEIRLDAGARADSTLLRDALGLETGGWASPHALGDAVEHALDVAATRGYPYAELGVTGFDWDSGGARVRIGGALGPLVIVSSVRFEGLTTTRPSLVRQTMGPLEGRPYNPVTAEDAAVKLRQLGLFRQVTFAGLESGGDWSRGDLVYKIEEPRYNAFEAAMGLQGPAGAREVVGLARIELGNLAGTGRAAALHWRSDGPGLQNFDASYREPMILGQPWALELGLSEQLQDTLYTRSRIGARVAMRLEPRRRLELSYEQERVVTTLGDANEATTQITGAALESDQRDDPVIPRRGLRGRVEGGQWFKTASLRVGGTSHAHLTTGRALLEWHRPLGSGEHPRAGLAWELSAAGVFSSAPVLEDYERL
ncbi:MAG: hypothetical protein ACHQ52_06375, partial [Candidatus Eisenbacteria bacterium]